MSNVGFIGLGIMGKPMALNLIKGGHTLFLHTRSGVPTELTDAGGKACNSAKEVAQQADNFGIDGRGWIDALLAFIRPVDAEMADEVAFGVKAAECFDFHGQFFEGRRLFFIARHCVAQTEGDAANEA